MNKRVRCTAAFAAAVMAASLLGGCGQNGVTAPENVEKYTADGELIKPEKITVMADGTVFTKRNGRDAFEARWEELTGIDIEFIQPDHSAYYDVVGQTFASGVKNWPDVILLSSTYYSGYAEEGALWDLTETYENSDLKKSGRLTGEDVIDGMRIGGRLYGLPVNRGGGCITYVKKKWLDNCNLEVPTNYDEYMNMLKAFTEGDQKKAEMLTRQNFNSEVSYEADGENPFRFGSFTTMGEFYVETGLNMIGMSDYKRILSLDSAMAVVQFKKDRVAYQRNFFISYPANVMVVRFSADQSGKQNLVFSYAPNPLSTGSMVSDGNKGLVYTAS